MFVHLENVLYMKADRVTRMLYVTNLISNFLYTALSNALAYSLGKLCRHYHQHFKCCRDCRLMLLAYE